MNLSAPNSRSLLRSRLEIGVLFFALLLSGIAAVINQVVWQRALRIYLGGSDALSSAIVVMVFMAGLGGGALVIGRMAQRTRDPLRAFGVVELLLCGINLGIAKLLALDLSRVAQLLQSLSNTAHLPRLTVFGGTCAALLTLPCALMGMTIPLASEIVQRQFRSDDKALLTRLFVLNTAGAVLGFIVTGLYALPLLGQRATLLGAVAANALAALSSLMLSASLHPPTRPPTTTIRTRPSKSFVSQIVIGFFLGFLALAYEMYLLRIVVLAHEPLPDRFAIIVASYLFFWSIGVFFAGRRRWNMGPTLLFTALIFFGIAPLFSFHIVGTSIYQFTLFYTLPCVGLGFLFSQALEQISESWGHDVGLFQGANTLGSCLGVCAVSLVGYEIHHLWTVLGIGTGYVAIFVYARYSEVVPPLRGDDKKFLRISAACLACIVAGAGIWRHSGSPTGAAEPHPLSVRSYFGREGVVEIVNDRELFWNGLWHSRLSHGDHIGTNNWLQAVIPYLTLPCDKRDVNVLVIGLGTGITASTLASSPRVAAVEAYEINQGLREILSDYPEGTLRVSDNPKVKIRWEDARLGLLLNPTQYDLIIQAPLYLKQAGSSILLSKEYFSLVKQHLKPGGVFSIYSNAEGKLAQAHLVRNTARNQFQYGESFANGYLLVVSDESIQYPACQAEFIAADKPANSPLLGEIHRFGLKKLTALLDRPKLPWDGFSPVITDDQPLVEYPTLVNQIGR